jgi:Uncharacterized protein conserved in bacteria (DUF2059)
VRWFVGLVFAAVIATLTAPSLRASVPDDAATRSFQARLELAQKYLVVTQREALVRDSYAKELRLGWAYCKDPACQAELDRDVSDVATRVAHRYVDEMARLLAQRLTAGQLKWAIRLYQSPDGQSLVRAQNGMADAYGQMGLSLASEARDDFSRRFCPSHPQLCTASPPTGAGTPAVPAAAQPRDQHK